MVRDAYRLNGYRPNRLSRIHNEKSIQVTVFGGVANGRLRYAYGASRNQIGLLEMD